MRTLKASGITATDVLSLMAIIAVLAVVFAPVLARARESRLASNDLSSAKSARAAALLYSEDYDESFPSADSDRGATHLDSSSRFYQPAVGTTLGDCLPTAPANFVSTGGGCKDLTTGLIWSATGYDVQRSVYTYSGATNFCSNLNEQGITGWRMATSSELSKFAADGAYYAVLDNFPLDKWSSTRAKGNAYFAVGLQTGVATAEDIRHMTADAICVK